MIISFWIVTGLAVAAAAMNLLELRRFRRARRTADQAVAQLGRLQALSAEAELTEFARRRLAAILEAEPAFGPAARGNGRILADLLRGGSPDPDIAIAGYVLAILGWAVPIGEVAGPDAWEVICPALAMAAVELTAIDRVDDLLHGPGPG